MAKARVYRQDALCPVCGSNWVKKDGHSRGKQQFKRNQCGRKHQEGAKHRFTDEQKARAVKMYTEGMTLTATAQAAGASIPSVTKWVEKAGVGVRARGAVSGAADKRAAE